MCELFCILCELMGFRWKSKAQLSAVPYLDWVGISFQNPPAPQLPQHISIALGCSECSLFSFLCVFHIHLLFCIYFFINPCRVFACGMQCMFVRASEFNSEIEIVREDIPARHEQQSSPRLLGFFFERPKKRTDVFFALGCILSWYLLII